MSPALAMIIAWALWAASWLVAAKWSDAAAKQATSGDQWLYRTLAIAGALMLLFRVDDIFQGRYKVWDLGLGANWTLVVVAALGLMFTWWARLYLGRLWSRSVTKKADHRVVDAGPYAIVRHPIYTGMIVAILAAAVLKGMPIGIGGAILIALAFRMKATLEERFLREHLEPNAYDSYRRRVPMLVPWGPKSA
jgi:protein-S-isoprenylcysteine O-methyltransferase Ste14